MAFNPKDHKPSAIIKPPKLGTEGGKPGTVISQLTRLEMEAKRSLEFSNNELKSLPNVFTDLGRKIPFTIEWWNLGSKGTDIQVGQCDTADLRNLLKLITGPKENPKRTIIHVQRMDTGEVIYDRRSTVGR